jgi:hypothetical protein
LPGTAWRGCCTPRRAREARAGSLKPRSLPAAAQPMIVADSTSRRRNGRGRSAPSACMYRERRDASWRRSTTDVLSAPPGPIRPAASSVGTLPGGLDSRCCCRRAVTARVASSRAPPSSLTAAVDTTSAVVLLSDPRPHREGVRRLAMVLEEESSCARRSAPVGRPSPPDHKPSRRPRTWHERSSIGRRSRAGRHERAPATPPRVGCRRSATVAESAVAGCSTPAQRGHRRGPGGADAVSFGALRRQLLEQATER